MAGSAVASGTALQGIVACIGRTGWRRLVVFAATEARAYDPGGVSVVSRITGMARSTIGRSAQEIEQGKQVETSFSASATFLAV